MDRNPWAPDRHGGGRVLVGTEDQGAGVAVYPRLVITAGHVVTSRPPEVSVAFRTQAERLVPAVGSVRFIDGRDAAAFGLADDVAWSRLTGAADGEPWSVSATGRRNDPVLTGLVTRASLQITDDLGNQVSAMQLLVDQDIGGFGGYSGSAVFNADLDVTGMLIEQLLQRLGTPRPSASNVLYALPISDVIGRLPVEIPVPTIGQVRVAKAAAGRDRPANGYFLRECFASLIEYYAENYAQLWADRGHAVDRLNGFLRHPAGGYLVATAPTGSGKTALIASLLNQRPERVAYHFFSQWYEDGLEESFFLQNILQQLVWLLGRDDDIPEPTGQLRAMYHYLISQPAGEPLTVVLDGLDEVTGWALRPYLSRRLPENISFVVTMQDEHASAARYFIPRDQTTFLRLDEPGTRVTRESLLAGQQLNALLDQLQARVLQTQVMQTEHVPMTEQEREHELALEAEANEAAARSAAEAAWPKMTTNAEIMKGLDQLLGDD